MTSADDWANTAGDFWLSSLRLAERRLSQISWSRAGLEVALERPEDAEQSERVRELTSDISISLTGDEVALDELDAYREDRRRHSIKLAAAYVAAREAGRSILDVDLDTAELRPEDDGTGEAAQTSIPSAAPATTATASAQWDHWAANDVADGEADGAEL